MSVAEYKKKMQGSGRSVKHGSPEHDAQVEVFQWAELMSNKYEELKLLMAIPNGASYGGGGGRWNIAKRMKAEGVRSGVPDIFLPIPVVFPAEGLVKAGCWIEMKAGKNKLTPEQTWWMDRLSEYGYRTAICYSAKEAITALSEYLRLDERQ